MADLKNPFGFYVVPCFPSLSSTTRGSPRPEITRKCCSKSPVKRSFKTAAGQKRTRAMAQWPVWVRMPHWRSADDLEIQRLLFKIAQNFASQRPRGAKRRQESAKRRRRELQEAPRGAKGAPEPILERIWSQFRTPRPRKTMSFFRVFPTLRFFEKCNTFHTKTMFFEVRGVPKWSQNCSQNASKIKLRCGGPPGEPPGAFGGPRSSPEAPESAQGEPQERPRRPKGGPKRAPG